MRLIPELLGHACPERWLSELNLGSGMFAFLGLNMDVPFVVYPRK
jgi:hypothetical protein